MSTANNTKSPRLRRGDSETTTGSQPIVSFTHYHIPDSYDCQTVFDDTLSLTEAVEFSDWDVSAWVESRLRGGYLTPRTARALYGVCPDDAAQYAVERYSMAEARQ